MKKSVLALVALAVLAGSTLAGPLWRREAPIVVPRPLQQVAVEVVAEFEHKPTTKRAFFRSLLKERLSTERRGERKRLLRRILADDDLQIIAIDYADYLQSLTPTLTVEEDPDGKFFRFFQWVIEHQDQIIAFLEKIIALFENISPETMSLESADRTTNCTDYSRAILFTCSEKQSA